MSKKSKRHQSVSVSDPVVESEVTTPVVATETPVADQPQEIAATEAPVAPVAETPAAEAAPAKVKKYPREGGKCWQVWNYCDTLKSAGTYVNVKDVRTHAETQGWNTSNASQEFYAWRKFHGIR
jgi:hypothetical protein